MMEAHGAHRKRTRQELTNVPLVDVYPVRDVIVSLISALLDRIGNTVIDTTAAKRNSDDTTPNKDA
ncbi:hypothetical protein [uncultured Enorma sp.]|uniref:hypothetical protein n=1 Tax=uncultured Enorma sp. TaxID=1714346 RepID=UPI00259AA87D|nr:hypothetical protein [uncultured Enorma sp.]